MSDTAPLAAYRLLPHIAADLVRLGLDPKCATAEAVLEALVLRYRRLTAWRRALKAARDQRHAAARRLARQRGGMSKSGAGSQP